MATNPLAPNPETNIDNPNFLPGQPEEDRSKGMPLGDPKEEEDSSRIPNPEEDDEKEENEREDETDEELPLA